MTPTTKGVNKKRRNAKANKTTAATKKPVKLIIYESVENGDLPVKSCPVARVVQTGPQFRPAPRTQS
jgi:hypothetical protein